jgi:hypothetical protein
MPALSADVARRAADVAEAAKQGGAWLDANAAQLRLDRGVVGNAFRRLARRAHRLRAAAERPTCVAVFGASQAGKSYLVSNLATPRGRPLTAVFGSRRVDFLTELNPTGGGESTGLVSRFTIRAVPAPADAPVPLRMLSQTDVVKIFANAYLEDFKIADLQLPDAVTVGKLFDKLSARAAPTPYPGLTGDDIEELREYFELHFKAHAVVASLGAAYWVRAADVIPRLPPELRAEAYAPLWNGTEPFTNSVRGMIVALASIGFPDTAFCGMDALLPREAGVLNASTLDGLDGSVKTMVRITSPKGVTADVNLALAAALIAEMTVPLAEKPWDFFEHTDLLDFPGARSRKEITRPEAVLAEPGTLGHLFLRGKVAYLFQRYNTEQEIAAMVLCVGPSVQEVQTLPRMVDGWISQTIGPTPEERQKQRNSLFFVLTKFDSEFEIKRGDDPSSPQRWSNRFAESLLKFFGGAYEWPTSWTPGKPFNNCFWLRSTSIGFPAVLDYAPGKGGELIEAGVRADAVPVVATRKNAYLQAPEVQAHFADPSLAWEEALRINDGGISYLADHLRPVCDPVLKAEQISGRVEELARHVLAQLRPHFRTGNRAEELERARERAEEVVEALWNCAMAQMLGPMLRAIQVTTEELKGAYWRPESEPDAAGAVAPVGAVGSDQDYRAAGMGKLLRRKAAAPAPTANAPAARDRFERLADMAIEEWSKKMSLFASDATLEAVYRLPVSQAITLTGEIERAARRIDLRGQIADSLRQRANFIHRSLDAVERPVMVMEREINSYVEGLGYDRRPVEKRPQVEADTGVRAVFAPRPPVVGLPPLGPTAEPYDVMFHVDWMHAVFRMFEENISDGPEGGVDEDTNGALGRILARLEAKGP